VDRIVVGLAYLKRWHRYERFVARTKEPISYLLLLEAVVYTRYDYADDVAQQHGNRLRAT
jgi:hypothetical protein